MVERRSIIFSKLFEGLVLSAAAAAAAAAPAPASAPAAPAKGPVTAPAVAVAAPATAAGGTATGGVSILTEVVPAEDGVADGATAEGPPVCAPAEVLGTGGSDVLGAGLLDSAGGWGWG